MLPAAELNHRRNSTKPRGIILWRCSWRFMFWHVYIYSIYIYTCVCVLYTCSIMFLQLMSFLSFLGLHSFRHAHHMNKWFHSQGVGLDDWLLRPTSFHVNLCFYNYSVWSSKKCQNYKYVCKYCNNKLVYVIILIIYCIYIHHIM
jgi:hypothetical protein